MRCCGINGIERNDLYSVANFLARTKSRLLAVSLEDLLGVVEQPNIPGTIDEHPNWRRRLPVLIEEMTSTVDVDALKSATHERLARGDLTKAVNYLVLPDRRLWADRRLRDRRAGRPRRIDRLAVLAGVRFGRLLCRTSRHREARPLADRAGGEIIRTSRRYRDNTLILETRFETAEGVVDLIDFMPPRGNASDVIRLVRGVRGRVRMHMQLVIRFGFGADIPWVKKTEDGSALLAISGQDMTVFRTPVQTRGENMTTVADFEIGEGDTIPFVLTYGPSHLPVPKPVDAAYALKDTEAFWNEWSSRCTYTGEYRDLVMRSLITLKAQTYAPTGGIVAAPTTSLPEKLGGARNWDYRFCWLRDATFTLLALINSGYTEEASAWHQWLLRAAAGSPVNMQIMYGIMGQRRLLEWEAAWLPGYEGAKPVRVGNAAHAQLQLDVYGELIDAFHQWRIAKLELDEQHLGAGMHGARASCRNLEPARSRHLGAPRRRQGTMSRRK